MTLQELMRNIQQDPVCRAMLPVDLTMLYPAFSVKRGILCAHILCHRVAVRPEGLEIWPPELRLEIACPRVRPISVVNLRFDGPYTEGTKLLPNRSPEEKARYGEAMGRLVSLGDRLLADWGKTGSADVSAYNDCLRSVLEPSQWQLLSAFAEP